MKTVHSGAVYGSPLFSTASTISLYIHVPFCAQKCSYCDFYSRSSRHGSELYVDSVIREMDLYLRVNPAISSIPVKTVFVGGGTPSLLTAQEWTTLASAVNDRFLLDSCVEWSIEVNPESFTAAKAESWRQSGVNRLSIGVQSLSDTVLKKAGRIHSADRVRTLLADPALRQFDRISCDLIYGLPGQKITDLSESLDELLSFPVVTHLSAYELTIAEETPFAALPASYFPGDEILADYEAVVLDKLSAAGFMRYEVSNYAKVDSPCLHNLRYWEMEPYLGLGPSAHSFDGTRRFAAVASLDQYAATVKMDQLSWEFCETITPEMFRQEYLFLALRTAAGISLDRYESLFGEPLLSGERVSLIRSLEKRGVARITDSEVALTDHGLNLADGIALKLV